MIYSPREDSYLLQKEIRDEKLRKLILLLIVEKTREYMYEVDEKFK